MADITMCANAVCPKAHQCYRVQADPSIWQSWTIFEFTIESDEVHCDNYWPVIESAPPTEDKS